jgi:NAD(P)H-hydrate epimerase
MKPAFTFREIREVEKAIIEKDGIPSLVLMENAGRNFFDVLLNTMLDLYERDIYIFCGKGNNAGDGFVIARHLAVNGINSALISLSSQLKGDALVNFKILKSMNSDYITFIDSFAEGGIAKEAKSLLTSRSKILVIDAMLGSGITGELGPGFKNYIELINKIRRKNKKAVVVSVDVPSGLSGVGEALGNPLVNADHTITMGAVKTEMLFGKGKENCGDITIVPIGITDVLLEKYNSYNKYDVELDDVKTIFPKRKKTSYKYSNGKALLIGGSKGLSGAIIMSSLSALKSGAGAVLAAFPSSLSAHFGRKLSEVIKTELSQTVEGSISGDSYKEVQKQINKADAVLIGPGLSLNPDTKRFLFDVITNCTKPLVIDADALTLIAEEPDILKSRPSDSGTILTPHIGEFSKLSGISVSEIENNRFDTVRNFAAEFNVNVVMKSETTFSCLADGRIFINSSGNEVLASAGSGDLLSGIIVSLLVQTGSVDKAMIAGNYLHGMTADLYLKTTGNSQTARQEDLINLIPRAVSILLN